MKKSVILLLICFLFLSFSIVSASQLKVTSEHPFLVNNNWIPASQLQPGDSLKTSDGNTVVIKNITEVEEKVEVYNLEASPYSDFIVEDGLVVHNSNNACLNPRCPNCWLCGGISPEQLPLSKLPRVGAVKEDIRLLYMPAFDPSVTSTTYVAHKLSSCDIPKYFYKIPGLLSTNHLGAKGVYYDGEFYLLLPPELEALKSVKFSTPHHADMLFEILGEKGILTPDMIPASLNVDSKAETVRFWEQVMASLKEKNPDVLKKAFGFEFEYVPANNVRKARVYVTINSAIDMVQIDGKIPISRDALQKAAKMATEAVFGGDIDVIPQFGPKTKYGTLWNQGV